MKYLIAVNFCSMGWQTHATDTLKKIVHSNKQSVIILCGINNKRQKQEQIGRNPKWAKFTYIGRETRFITKLLKNTNIKIAYTTNNNLGKL
jgi:hypothetical protein